MSRQPRLHIDTTPAVGEQLSLTASLVRHLRAHRLRRGDSLVLFDGGGGDYEAVVTAIDRREAWVSVERHRQREMESPLAITLIQGVSKGERMDFAVQKAVELGVDRILPMLSALGVVRLGGERAGKRREHWQRVATAACEQCGRNRVPEVASPLPIEAIWSHVTELTGLVLHPDGETRLRALSRPATGFALLVGPEGGLSDAEMAAAVDHGFHRLCLGPRILRTESAGLAALAALQGLLGDLG